jgi:predicted Mrr-cat superfamily restriction endonuclease
MRLLDADQLIDLLLDHYDHLAEEARGLLPLRRVWVPDRPSGTGE